MFRNVYRNMCFTVFFSACGRDQILCVANRRSPRSSVAASSSRTDEGLVVLQLLPRQRCGAALNGLKCRGAEIARRLARLLGLRVALGLLHRVLLAGRPRTNVLLCCWKRI